MKNVRLDYKPRQWQKECHKRKKRFTVLALHRRAGKTELAIMELIDHAIKFKKDLGLFCYIAPFLKQAKIIAWSRLKQRVEPLRIAGAVDVNEGELQVVFKHNGAIIRIFGADNPDAMRGVRLDGIVIDEVAQIKPELWVDIVQPALSDRLGWAIFIGTPSGINLFSELYYRAGELPDWHAARFTVYDTGALDEKEVERLKKEMPEASFAREYLCDFSASGEDQLISLSDTEAAAKRVVPERDYLGQPKILGVDPARFGDDRSVIIKRQGLYCYEPLIYKGIDNMDLAARVATVIDQWVPDAVFVDAGAGAGDAVVPAQGPDALTRLSTQSSHSATASSTGLLRAMNKEEVEAVLGHEVAHVANGDMVTLTLIQGVVNTFVVFFARIVGSIVDKAVFRTERGTGPGRQRRSPWQVPPGRADKPAKFPGAAVSSGYSPSGGSRAMFLKRSPPAHTLARIPVKSEKHCGAQQHTWRACAQM